MSRPNTLEMSPRLDSVLTFVITFAFTLMPVLVSSCAGMTLGSGPKALHGQAPVVWMTSPQLQSEDVCGVSRMLIAELRAELRSELVVVHDRVDAGSPLLEITITRVDAAGGGPFSGSKKLWVRGRLEHHGERVGSFTASASESPFSGGSWGTSTCGMLEEAVEDVAEDIADWLVDPSLGAEL